MPCVPLVLQDLVGLIISVLLLGDFSLVLLLLLQLYSMSMMVVFVALSIPPLGLILPFPTGINALFSHGPRRSAGLARVYALWNLTSVMNVVSWHHSCFPYPTNFVHELYSSPVIHGYMSFCTIMGMSSEPWTTMNLWFFFRGSHFKSMSSMNFSAIPHKQMSSVLITITITNNGFKILLENDEDNNEVESYIVGTSIHSCIAFL